MDTPEASVLSVEIVGPPKVPRVAQSRHQQCACLEHSEVSSWAVALESQSGALDSVTWTLL